jgi:CHAT domain-containing protein
MPEGPPSLALLTDAQRVIVTEILDELTSRGFDKRSITPIERDLTVRMADAIKTDEEVDRMASELELWVQWHGKEAFWLTYFFQKAAMMFVNLRWRVTADLLFSDAQANFNQDLSLSSLEVAYNNLVALKLIRHDDSVSKLETRIRERLRLYHAFYSRWCRPFDPSACNPVRENLYSCKTYSDLVLAFPPLGAMPHIESGGSWAPFGADRIALPIETWYELETLVKNCDKSGDLYHMVVLRRFLGQFYQDSGNSAEALKQFGIAWGLATEEGLDTEIGHLDRCQADILLRTGHPMQAAQCLYQAHLHEEKAFPLSVYWEALTERMWGDARKAFADTAVAGKKEEYLKLASTSYKNGRILFDVDMGILEMLPIDVAVRQQMDRAFTERSLSLAAQLGDYQGILAEIEENGPREATEIVVEMIAAQKLSADSIEEYRRSREVFHRYLTTIPTKFEDYIRSLPEQYRVRHDYTNERIALTGPITEAVMSDKVAEQVLSLRRPSEAFLTFNVGSSRSAVALLDLETGKVNYKEAPFRTSDLSQIHQRYRKDYLEAQKATNPESVMTSAIDHMLEAYQALAGGVLDELLGSIECKSLKIFPCLQMNAVPLHALKVGGRRLIDSFDVSYCPTMGLFLKLQRKDQDASSHLNVAFDPSIEFFKGLERKLKESLGEGLTVMQRPTWQAFLKSISYSPRVDLLFACHGQYATENPSDSRLFIDGKEGASFSQIFSDLDLRGYRSVVIGACESGLARTEVAAEFVGLPIAFLSAGVRYVVGSLWEVNLLATSILLGRYFELLNSGTLTVPASLNVAQRDLASMNSDSVVKWVEKYYPEKAPNVKRVMKKMGDPPFGHPYYWAGFYVSGDF